MRPKRLQDSLLLALLLAASLFAGLGAWLAYQSAFSRALAQGTNSLTGLLTAVEKTASIGAYAEDGILLKEVVDGLSLDPLAASVEVLDTSGKVWVSASSNRSNQDANGSGVWVKRTLSSPFDKADFMGTLRIEAHMDVMRAMARSEASLLALMLLAQSIGVACLLYWVATRLVSQPIVKFAERLRTITPGSGARLSVPVMHANDELGALVNSANALLEAQDQALMVERNLRTEIAQLGAEFKAIFSSSSAGIFVMTPDMRLLHCNEKALALSGLQAAGANEPEFEQFLENTFAQPELLHEMVTRSTLGGTTEAADLALAASSGPSRWVHCLITVRTTGQNPPAEMPGLIEGVMYDITERKQTERATSHWAEHDPLTGLRNRRGCDVALGQMLAEASAGGIGVAVMHFDLDGFKSINDTHGHAAGDIVLQQVAKRIRSHVRRGSDLCVRLGGDEFLVALRDTHESSANLCNTAVELLDSMDQPIALGNGLMVTVGASVGIACAPRHGVTADALIHQADVAMYLVKRTGKQTFAMAWAAPIHPAHDVQRSASFCSQPNA